MEVSYPVSRDLNGPQMKSDLTFQIGDQKSLNKRKTIQMTRNRGSATSFVMVLLLMVGVLTLMAHMRVQKTMPEDGAVLSGAPSRIQVWYTQDPDPAISQLSLEGADGEVALDETAIGDDKSLVTTLPTALAGGMYTVKWRTAGDDGHTQRGDFTFTVRAAD